MSGFVVSGKINFFKNKYQITNPDYVTKLDHKNYVLKICQNIV